MKGIVHFKLPVNRMKALRDSATVQIIKVLRNKVAYIIQLVGSSIDNKLIGAAGRILKSTS